MWRVSDHQPALEPSGGDITVLLHRSNGGDRAAGDEILRPVVALSANRQLIAAPGYPWGPMNLWDAKTFRHVGQMPEMENGPSSAAFSPSGRRLAVASSGKEGLKLWDLELRENVLTLDFPEVRSWRTAFSPDGNLIVSHSSEGTLRFWRAPSWQEIEEAEAAERNSRPPKAASP